MSTFVANPSGDQPVTTRLLKEKTLKANHDKDFPKLWRYFFTEFSLDCPFLYFPELPSHRNQSTDLLYNSIDWFLCEGNTGISWAKKIILRKLVIF